MRHHQNSMLAINLANDSPSSDDRFSYFGEGAPKQFSEKIGKLTDETSAIDDRFDQSSVLVKDRQSASGRMPHSLLVEEWEGRILSIEEDRFVARLVRVDVDSNEEIEGDFELSSIPVDERGLVREGMVFSWAIGKETKKSGAVSNSDYVIFKRMPSWKGFDIDEPSSTVDAFAKAFNRDNSSNASQGE